MSVEILDWSKKAVGAVDLDPQVFQVPLKKEILHAVVRWQLASRRSGTHKVKTRAFVSGGGKKPFKQKGTGNARQGSSRSPLNPGGAKLFGPVPRDYGYALPKKVRRLGLRMALSYLHERGRVFILEDFKSQEGKTKELAQRLKSFDVSRAVLVDSAMDPLFERAVRNMGNYRYFPPGGVNVFDLLKFESLLMTPSGLDALVRRCLSGG